MHLLVFLACADDVESEDDPASGGSQSSLGIIAQAEAAGPMGPELEPEAAKREANPECAWLPYQTPKGEYFILSVSPETSGTFAGLPTDCRDPVTVQRSPSTDPIGYDPSSVPVRPGQVVRIYGCNHGAWAYVGEMDLEWTTGADVREVPTIKQRDYNFQCTEYGHNVPFPARVTVHRVK